MSAHVLEYHCRMQSVRVKDTHVSLQAEIVAVLIIVGLVVAVVVARVSHFNACLFLTRKTVYDCDVLRRIAFGLFIVVCNAVIVCISIVGVKQILSPYVCLAVPESCSVAGLHYDFSLSVAVNVVCRHHVVVAVANIYVRSHVDGPQSLSVASVAFHFV